MKVMISKAINASTLKINKNDQIKRIKTKKVGNCLSFTSKRLRQKSEIWFMSEKQFTTSNIEYNYICLFVVNQSSSNKLPPCSSNINILIIFSSTWSTATTFDASWISSTTTTWSINKEMTWLYTDWAHSKNNTSNRRKIFWINRSTFFIRFIA